MLVLSVVSSRFPYMSTLISGGYSDGAPPLPIPNREVKPVRADGTASSGRVGSRRFFQKSPAFHAMWSAGFLVCIICMIRMKAASRSTTSNLLKHMHKARHLIMSRLMSYLRAFAPISNLLSFLCEHNRKLVAPQRKALY